MYSLAMPDIEISNQMRGIREKYPDLTPMATGDVQFIRELMAWVESVDLIKDDDDKLGAYNWSYTAKHIAERDMHRSTSNSELIIAALICGYVPNYIRGPNCDFKRGCWYEQP